MSDSVKMDCVPRFRNRWEITSRIRIEFAAERHESAFPRGSVGTREFLLCEIFYEEIEMIDLIKKALYTGVGLAVFTKEKAEELVQELTKQAKLSEAGRKRAF